MRGSNTGRVSFPTPRPLICTYPAWSIPHWRPRASTAQPFSPPTSPPDWTPTKTEAGKSNTLTPACRCSTSSPPASPTGREPHKNTSWKEQYADPCVQIFDKFAPGFADSVTNRVVFSNRYFGSTFSAHAGDYSHGLLQPNQLWTGRVVEGADKFATPVDGLYLR